MEASGEVLKHSACKELTGAILDISPRTVETRVYKMSDDFVVRTIRELVRQATRHGTESA